jgi:hypothetical protein
MSNVYTLFNLIQEDDTFMIFFYKQKEELTVLEKWYKILNKDFYIKETDIKSNERIEVEQLFDKPYPLNKQDKINSDIVTLTKYYKYLNEFKDIRNRYKNPKNSIFSDVSESVIIKSIATEKLFDTFNIPTRNDNLPIIVPNISISSGLERPKSDTKDEILAFNDGEYDDINNCIGGTQFSNIDDEDKKVKILIIYSVLDMRPLLITEYTKTEESIAKENRFGFEFINVIEITPSLIKSLSESFNDKIFNNKEEVKEFINLSLKINLDNSEKDKINNYLSRYITKNDNIEHKVKFNVIASKIELYFNMDSNNIKFRNRLAKYLIDYGFKKKRFSDGFYYYGVIFNDFENKTDTTTIYEILRNNTTISDPIR